MVKNPSASAGDRGLIPGLERSPGEKNGKYSCLENHHGQRSLAGYSTWHCKESDMTEQLRVSVSCPSQYYMLDVKKGG